MSRFPAGSRPVSDFSTVEFVADWNDPTVFNDLGHVEKVDDLSSMLDQWRIDPILPGAGGVEATVGRLDTVDASLLTLLAQYSRAVCRVRVPEGEYTDYLGDPAIAPWTGTGFLVAPNLLLTNHHVLNSEQVAEHATVEFNFQISESDLLNGPPDISPAATTFQLKPDRLFLTSGMKDFDYSFVWIEGEAAARFGSLRMTRGSFTVRQTEPTYIIHHPGGKPKQVSLDDTEVLSVNSSAVLYAADTAGGSSGAPVFCNRGRLVALHHAWRSTRSAQSMFPGLTGKLNDGNRTDVVNEGIKLSAIAIDLEGKIATGGADGQAAETVLATFNGSDTLTGLFGSLGRHDRRTTGSEGGRDQPNSAYEKVVQVYRGSEMDIDIGAWNIEWFNRDYDEPGKLDRVAKIITDLNLDIWALVEVSPEAVKALVETLGTRFKQRYKAAFSEPDAKGGKQTTAVLWRPNVVEAEKIDWPSEIDELLRKSSRDDLPFEAVHGKIFNRYPALFRFKLQSQKKNFDFLMVPLHLKARGEGSLRRRLASKVLSYAVEQMIENYDEDSDWILLGDVNATLASRDFEALTDGGFTPLSAADEANGAFTYLKSPYKSLIDNIFVSENLSKNIDQEQFFIVATDRSVSRFVDDISDHRPVAMRLSLADLPNANFASQATSIASETNEDAVFSALLSSLGMDGSNSTTRLQSSEEVGKGWLLGNRDKATFLRDNGAKIANRISKINSELVNRWGDRAIRLTPEDVAAVFMAEAGISASGSVDPTFVHSNGEHGLLPLPNNIDFWVDPSAPAFNAPMSVDENVHFYLAYLAALKNKPVKKVLSRTLYPDLFRENGIAGCAKRGAKLLAGVVHGYFWSGNYSDNTVPLAYLLNGYAKDTPLSDLMRPTSYVHAGKPLLYGRQLNLDEGLALTAVIR